MKKLFLVIIVAASVNAIGQKTHKAAGYKPISSMEYIEYQGNDSTLFAISTYFYNSQNQIVKEIITCDTNGDVDSVITDYDLNNRIISTQSYRNGALFYSKTWNYDLINSQIDYYEEAFLGGSNLDSVIHVVYKGVRDFDNVEEDFSSLLNFMETGIELRDCDSIFVHYYDTASSSWTLAVKAMPYYNQNGKPDSVRLELDLDFLVGLFGADSAINELLDIVDIMSTTLTLIPAYNGGVLDEIKGNLVMKVQMGAIPLPVTDPNFIVLKNQYNSADLLTETKIDMKIFYSLLIDQYLGGTKQTYSYDVLDNVSCMVTESSINGTIWDIDSKIYYEYDIEDIYDIVLYDFGTLDKKDIVGESINIEVILKNTSLSTPSQPINITALVISDAGIDTLTEVIPPINAFSEMPYTFTNAYVVPDVYLYDILVYIDSQDTIPTNDTIHIVDIETNKVGINEINGATIFVSQNIPNPARDIAMFTYSVPTDGKMVFTVYSVSGQVLYVRTDDAKSGENTLEVSVSNLSAGFYFYSMEFDGRRVVRKMVVD